MSTDLTSYLNYLQDLSRRILQRGGMEQVLYRKSRSRDPRYMPFDSSQTDLDMYLAAIASELKDDSSRRLFLGVGVVAGSITSTGRWTPIRKVAGPLVYAPVELVAEEPDTIPDLEVEWEEATLNYDLLTVLLQGSDEESEETTWTPQGSLS